MKKLSFVLVALIVLSAHDLFLKTDNYYVKPNSLIKLFLFNGTFDKSENIITRDRIMDASIHGPDYSFTPGVGSWYDLDNATYLQFKSGEEGTYLAGISTAPKDLALSAEDFNGYLDHDGILDELEARKRDGTINEGSNERYSKHVKCVFQVGETRSDDYKKELGYPIEFLLLDNPYELSEGDELRFTLLRAGEPLSNQLVYYSNRPGGKLLTDEHVHDNTSVRTDDQGQGVITLNGTGHWYLRSIHMERIQEGDLNYESNWATITFEIK